MSDEHRLGVDPVNLVVRHLKLEPAEQENIFNAIEEIDQEYGLDSVQYEAKNNSIHLAYDATRICLDGLEDILHRHQIEVGHGWWTHFKEGYYRFVDQNVKENASHTPWSCHKNPPSGKK